MSVSIEHLSWDSDFFKITIGRAALDGSYSAMDCAEAARSRGVECLYLVVPGAHAGHMADAVRAGGRLVDLRIELDGDWTLAAESGRTRTASASETTLLHSLARELAAYSRFSADPGFAAERVGDMYCVWVDKCLQEGVVVTPRDAGSGGGFVGARRNGDKTDIELVYVSPGGRAHGIASALVSDTLHTIGAPTAHVATQAANVAAQRLYQSLGFRTSSVSALLHLWL